MDDAMAFFRTIARALGIAKLTQQVQELRESIALLPTKLDYSEDYSNLRRLIMALQDSIARLTALAEKIEAAVTVEAAEAEAIIKERTDALVEKDNAIADLKAQIESLKAQVADPEVFVALDEAIAKVDTAVGKVSQIVVSPTPVTDVVVDSVKTDPAPTPQPVDAVVVEPSQPTPIDSANAAIDAVTAAVTEVTEAASSS